MKKLGWKLLGLLFVAFAYVGVITPGVPTTFFVLLAVWAFSKSSPKFEAWVRNHPTFGTYIKGWETKRIYPIEGKYAMMVFMCFSMGFLIRFSPVWVVIMCTLLFTGVVVWAFRFPSDEWEYNDRIKNGKKIGWLK